ncbi:AaceriADL167Wp [[Ashbya] aceris (nom. inval.)]|nr:AaceriADL167Wp [[Ashbya] aceris (nom. inval.)]
MLGRGGMFSGLRALSTGATARNGATQYASLARSGMIVRPGENARPAKPDEQVVKYVLNCLFTKNNTHFTYSAIVEDRNFLANNAHLSYNDKFLYYLQLPQQVKLHLSTGQLGFRKAARGEYEAAFQTAAKLFQTLRERQLLDKGVEIIMKDFGKGREAFVAALNGKEGTHVRPAVTRVSDATPLKFGGVRAPRRRRL